MTREEHDNVDGGPTSGAGPGQAPTGGRPEHQTSHYPRSAELLQALISAWAEARGFLLVASRLRDTRGRTEREEGFQYIPKPPEGSDPGLERMWEVFEKQLPPHHTVMVRAIDNYYRVDRGLRRKLDEAANAAERAAAELDSPSVPPLERTSIAIRRALNEFRGAIPSPLTDPWWRITENGTIENAIGKLQLVDRWIDEVKLLVQPPHSLPHVPQEPESRQAAEVTPAERGSGGGTPRISAQGRLVLIAMHDLGATEENARQPAKSIAARARGVPEEGLVKATLRDLRLMQLVLAREGQGGGYWLTPAGMAAIEEETT